ncbi:MAG: DUF493 family protein [Spirochaetales bacterium]|nr:DUF493 family protein [Spirochaetales bacterium]
MNKELQFPVVYDLRVIYSGSATDGLERISKLLKDLSIDSRNGVEKDGGKGQLVRLNFNITILNKEQMNTLYSNLKVIPEIKWAT